MMKRIPLAQDDRGASAILVAASLVLLMGFAAVAIDLAGKGFNERRQDQSAADVGALAAVQFARPVDLGNLDCSGYSGLTLSRCNGAVEAMAVANATLDSPLTLADWTDPARCGAPPAGFTVSPITECVAFTTNNQRAWVQIPTIDTPTTFGRIIGFASISTTADAIAGSSFGVPGGVLPFLLPGSATDGDYNCLKTGPNPKFGACDPLPSSGNFGSMDFFLYGNEDLDYSIKCNGDTNGRLVANIARGIDHPLGIHPGPPYPTTEDKEEQGNCPDWNAEPNMAEGQTGVGSNLEQGMLYGDSAYAAAPYPGRIQTPDNNGFLVRNGGGSTAEAWVDDTPLWTYLKTDLPPGLCNPIDPIDTPLEMLACIAWAKSTKTEIFTDDLVNSRRYGWTPEIWEDDFKKGTATYHIKDFRPVYIDTILFGCNANKCDTMYTPGVADIGPCPSNPLDAQITCGVPGNANSSLSAVTAYILSQDIVPANAKTPQPGSESQRTFNLTE